MKTIKTTFFLLTGLALFQICAAQDSISVKDAGDIRFKAERMIKELNQLMGLLSTNDIETNEKYELIRASYSGSPNRIFRDSSVLVEDDTNPAFRNSGQSKDEPVGNYLKDFDLLYKKSDEPSVDLSHVSCSKVKKGENIYVKVYFNSLFKNKDQNDSAYHVTNRVAEISASKVNNKWAVYIGRIGFFNPADTVNDVLNNIPLFYPSTAKTLLTGQDSVAAVAEQQSFEDRLTAERRQKEAEEERYKREKIKSLLNKGDQALNQSDFTGAIKLYSDAKDIDPYDLSVRASISKARNLEQTSALSSKQLYDKLIQKAKLEENSRLYENALRDYKSAFSLKPEEAAAYGTHIKELTVKFRTLSELEEKYNANQFKEAIKDYDRAIKKDNGNSDYYLGRGKCYDKINETSKALKDYSQAYNLDNNNLGALKYRAELLEKTNQPFKALTDYKTYLTIDKDNMDIYEKISNLHLQLNQRNEAIEDLDEALSVNPKASHVYLSKGLLLFDKNDFKNAVINFTNSIQTDSNNALAHYYRGKTMLSLKDVSKAAGDFNIARNKGLDEPNLRNIQNFGLAFYQRAEAHFKTGLTDSAIILDDYAILVDPKSSLYRFSRGEYYFSRKNYPEAIKSYDEAVNLRENYIESYYKRGLSYYLLANYPSGIDNFEQVLRYNSQDIMAEKGRGDCYFALKNYSDASRAYEHCVQLMNTKKGGIDEGTEAVIYNMRGKSYFELVSFEKALEDFKSAIKYNKGLDEAYYNRGHTYYKMNQLNDAIDDLSKALHLRSDHYQWNYVLGMAYRQKKDYGNAANSFTNAVKLDSLSALPDAVYYKGNCYYELHDYTAALPCYSRSLSLKLDTSFATFNNELGNIYLNLNKYDSAYSFFNKSYKADSTDGIASYGIASAILSQGKKDESLSWFEKAFKAKIYKYSDIKKDKLITAIRDDKRFKELLKKYY